MSSNMDIWEAHSRAIGRKSSTKINNKQIEETAVVRLVEICDDRLRDCIPLNEEDLYAIDICLDLILKDPYKLQDSRKKIICDQLIVIFRKIKIQPGRYCKEHFRYQVDYIFDHLTHMAKIYDKTRDTIKPFIGQEDKMNEYRYK